MKRSPRTAVLLGAAALLVAVAGCSSSGSSGSSGGSDKTLTMWTFKQSEVKALQAAGDAWGAKNGMTVKITAYTPDDAYKTKVEAAAKSKTLPDIVSTHSQGEDYLYAESGIVDDLTDDFTSQWQSRFLPGVVKSATITQQIIDNSGTDPATTLKDLKAGHSYSVPYLVGTPGVVFARTKYLKAAGVTSLPTTWADWVTDVEKTRKVSVSTGGMVTGMQTPETGYFWLYRPMAYAYMGKTAFVGRQSRNQNPSWSSAESQATLKLYDQLSPLWSPGVLNLGIDQADQAFASGKAAWDVGGTFTLSSLTTFGLSSSEVQVFRVPAASGGKLTKLSYEASPLVSASIASTSTHKKEALSFLDYLTSTQGATAFAKDATDLPATKIDSSSITSPILRQLIGLISTTSDSSTFAPNDFSADPPGTIGHDTAVQLSGLVAKTTTVVPLSTKLSGLYKAAWAAAK